jgi:DNA-binding transcriptional MocR family regulator
MMNRYLLESQAWKSLNATARGVYVHMAMKYYGSNNGRIGYSVRAGAEELKIGLATASRALADLQDRGFIVPKKRGAFSLKVRHASEWRLTDLVCNVTGDLPTKDFMRWTPDKNKTRYPQRKRTVSVVEAIGICGGSEQDSNTSHGICNGSVEAQFHPSSVSVAEHIYLPGRLASEQANDPGLTTALAKLKAAMAKGTAA